MKFISFLIISLSLSNISFADTRVGGGGVFSINRSIESLTAEHKASKTSTLNILEIIFENGDVVEADNLINGFLNANEARSLKAQGVSGFILKDGRCILLNDIITSGDDGRDDSFIVPIKRGGEGGGESPNMIIKNTAQFDGIEYGGEGGGD